MIKVEINAVDLSDIVIWNSLRVEQNLTSEVDTAQFAINKYGGRTFTPAIDDAVIIYDGASKIFGGRIAAIDETNINGADGLRYNIRCVDYSFDLNNLLVAKSYDNNTVKEIIDDIIANFAPTYTSLNVSSDYEIEKIVFNQVSVASCLKKLAALVKYEWYVDEDKDVHFFAKFTTSAPFNLTDTSENYITDSLKRKIDGSQIVNSVKVRGGEYDGVSFTDNITVSGSDSKSFKLPYKFSNLTIKLNSVSQVVGIDFIDEFADHDVLYNYNERTIRWENNLSAGDVIEFTGNPKIRVLVTADNADSIAEFGLREKIITDSSIEDNATARLRARAEVDTYRLETNEVTFETREAGLRAGQVMNINSTRRDINTDFIIERLVFKTRTRDDFMYEASLVTTKKYRLTEILRKLMQPSAEQINAAEVPEILKTDTVKIKIGELVYRQTAQSDEATITIDENIGKDPLGEDTEPDWVLAPYFPTSISDTKRVGLLDYSLKVY